MSLAIYKHSHFLLTQAERAPLVDCGVQAFPDARRSAASLYLHLADVSTELVWLQWDHCPRRVQRTEPGVVITQRLIYACFTLSITTQLTSSKKC